MKFTNTIAALLSVAALGVGCGGGAQEKAPADPTDVDGWWNNPGAIRDRLAAVGAADMIGGIRMARTTAYTDGSGQIAAMLETRINTLTEIWAKEVGDLAAGPESFTSLVNNESMTQLFTNAKIAGARAHKYKEVDGVMYCLVTLEDPTGWTNNVLDELEKQALQDETLWKTQVMKNEFAEKMDKLRKEQTAEVEKEQDYIDRLATGN